ncbi:MAG: nitroreductase [Oscillospiraceae bacterium]|nr:nitroreductase [Oscillospiraceae bacterium]
MNALELFVTRRSTRAFRDAPIEQEKLDQILEAGRHAPSGGNNQTTHLLVIRDKAVLAELAKLVKEEFAKMEVTEGMYKSMANSIRASKGEKYIFHYDPAVLILTANRADYSNNIADCACVLENMMVMANALDLGSCWINQLKWLNENEPVTAYLRTLGLAQGERVYGAVSIGYAKTEDGLPSRKPLPRTGNPVTFI